VGKKRQSKSFAAQTAALSNEQLVQLVAQLSEALQQRGELRVPVSLFAAKLSPAEALVKYLKEQEKLRYADIARLLNRDQRGIWCTYQRAQRKQSAALSVPPSPHTIPVSLFAERKCSILEYVAHHLRGQNLSHKDIAQLVNKSPSTIATVYHRARRKLQ
jgi:DNA-directed RNA polymerase specialized sigma24 family protein